MSVLVKKQRPRGIELQRFLIEGPSLRCVAHQHPHPINWFIQIKRFHPSPENILPDMAELAQALDRIINEREPIDYQI